MARVRVRDPSNRYWLDICYSDFFVRNAANTGWVRMVPNGFLAVRNGDNTQWLAVGCVDPDVDRCSGSGDPVDPNNIFGICIENND